MSKSIPDIVPDPELLLSLEPEEVGGVILEHLNSLDPRETEALSRYNFSLADWIGEYSPECNEDEIKKVLMEGWVWLEREGLLAPKPGSEEGWFFVTRRGKSFKSHADYTAYRRNDLLPRRMLHPNIAQASMPSFSRGVYDTAVFNAFKEVEIAVRKRGEYSENDVGTKLMRKAFHHQSGPLRDVNLQTAEREALSSLFAGAIGLYKNPHSHRNVALGAEEAAEMVILASHLLRIAESGRVDQESEREPNGI